MDEKEYKLELEKIKEREKSRRNLYHVIFWLGFWALTIGSCTILEVL